MVAMRAGMLDELRAQARPPRLGQVGGHGGGASDVERDDRASDPRSVGGVLARRQVGQRAVLEFGDDLLDDRVFAVTLIGLDSGQYAVGDERVVAVSREQLWRGISRCESTSARTGPRGSPR